MKIALLSDLHVEFWAGKRSHLPKPKADVLVLAGDIAVGHKHVSEILKEYADDYKNVIYLPGNHEYYGSSIQEFDNSLVLPSNVFNLNPDFVEIDGTTFIGATLWTNFRNNSYARHAASNGIRDFYAIRGFKVQHAADLFDLHFNFIKQQYENTKGPKIIVTHFIPATQCISKRFQGLNLLNYYFANNLGDWIENLTNTTWLFGHTHDTIDITIGTTRLLSNPYGYQGYEVNKDFKNAIINE